MFKYHWIISLIPLISFDLAHNTVKDKLIISSEIENTESMSMHAKWMLGIT